MKIYISNDHTGVAMKNAIVKHLKEKNYEVINLGVDDEKTSSYPELGMQLAKKVVEDNGSRGIVICGTGIGIGIAANKVNGAIAATLYEEETARLARQHNDANILSTGARLIAIDKAIKLVDIFLNTKFEGGRHENRVCKLKKEYKNGITGI